MIIHRCAAPLLGSIAAPVVSIVAPLAMSLVALPSTCPAQGSVQLHSVTILADDNVQVVYSKSFATCAHMRFSDSACRSTGTLTHRNNVFCRSGSNVSVTLPPSQFVAGFGPRSWVFLHDGNNANVRSACVQVECDGSYGTGCAGAGGVPVLAVDDACPGVGTTVIVSLSNGAAGAAATVVIGLGRTSLPLLGCTLLVDPIVLAVPVSLDASGSASFSLTVPAGAAGAIARMQGVAADGGAPQGVSATGGFEVRVRP